MNIRTYVKYDENFNPVGEYVGLKAAAESVGCHVGTISDAVKQGNKIGGYYWTNKGQTLVPRESRVSRKVLYVTPEWEIVEEFKSPQEARKRFALEGVIFQQLRYGLRVQDGILIYKDNYNLRKREYIALLKPRIRRRPITEAGAVNLAIAIIKQAERDYISAYRRYNKEYAMSLEDFFLSRWGQTLSLGNGEELIKRVRRLAQRVGRQNQRSDEAQDDKQANADPRGETVQAE